MGLTAQFLAGGAGFTSFVVAVACGFCCLRFCQRFALSRLLPTTLGTILSSKIESHEEADGKSYSADVRYQYHVGNNAFESDRVFWGGPGSSDRQSFAERLVRRYQSGR